MKLFFTKMEGLGNDFIFIDDRKQEISTQFSYKDLAIRLCNRNFGIGGDEVFLLLRIGVEVEEHR